MLKTVSSITNAIGALNYKGTWDANANSPALASSVGTKGDYYVVSTAGSTNLNGISNWGIGDWAVFNGSVWQRVEGGADLNGVNLSVSGTSTLDGNVTFKDNLTQGTAAKGVNFTANTPAAGMTSRLLNWYEEGTWTPTDASGAGLTFTVDKATYTRIGNLVSIFTRISFPSTANGSAARITGLPFNTGSDVYATSVAYTNAALSLISHTVPSDNDIMFTTIGSSGATVSNSQLSTSYFILSFQYSIT
jgi:hypothetical protein